MMVHTTATMVSSPSLNPSPDPILKNKSTPRLMKMTEWVGGRPVHFVTKNDACHYAACSGLKNRPDLGR